MKRPTHHRRRQLVLYLGALFSIACPPAFQLAAEIAFRVVATTMTVLAWLVSALSWLLTTTPGAALLGIALAAALVHWAGSQLRHGVPLWGRA